MRYDVHFLNDDPIQSKIEDKAQYALGHGHHMINSPVQVTGAGWCSVSVSTPPPPPMESSVLLLSIFAPHLLEVCVDVLSASLVQLRAADLLGKASDADDISRLQMLGEEIAARLGHVLELIPCTKKNRQGQKNHYCQCNYLFH